MRRILLSALALPVATLCVFAALAALSFLEVKKTSSGSAPKPRKATATLERYADESRELEVLRLKSREGLTAESILAALAGQSQEEAPGARTVICWVRALSEKTPEAADALVRGLLHLWQETKPDPEGKGRRAVIEEVLTLASLLVTDRFTLTEEGRADVLSMLEDAAHRGRQVAGALSLLCVRIGEPRDLPALRRIRERSTVGQVRLELNKVIKALEAREISTAAR
jgi:hypothetical protein